MCVVVCDTSLAGWPTPRESHLTTLTERRAEYDQNVWDHTLDAFQLTFDERAPFDKDALDLLVGLTDAISSGQSNDDLGRTIASLVGHSEARLFVVLQAAGLTRNKILTDLKASSSALPNVRVPSTLAALLNSAVALKTACDYLAVRVRKVLEPLTIYEDPRPALEAVNQVSWPGWIRQERAKRQGHEAEYRVAVMLEALGIPFVPEEKAYNPLCRDAQIDAISYDIVVPDLDKPVVAMKSTVQTSNIGQFGESKANLEVTEAKESLARSYREPPMLVAMIDGVGFRSNIQGLNGVLENADEFCQFKTIWKGAVIAADLLSIPLHLALPAEAIERQGEFLRTYGSRLTLHEATAELRASLPATAIVDAGEAFLWREN